MAASGRRDDQGDNGGTRAAAADTRGGERDGQADGIGHLPGVVNDLPEVAPHEWIYLMS